MTHLHAPYRALFAPLYLSKYMSQTRKICVESCTRYDFLHACIKNIELDLLSKKFLRTFYEIRHLYTLNRTKKNPYFFRMDT